MEDEYEDEYEGCITLAEALVLLKKGHVIWIEGWGNSQFLRFREGMMWGCHIWSYETRSSGYGDVEVQLPKICADHLFWPVWRTAETENLENRCRCGAAQGFRRKMGNNIGLYCAECGKWFKWIAKTVTHETAGDYTLYFGKHKGKTLGEVLALENKKDGEGYLRWIQTQPNLYKGSMKKRLDILLP